MGLQTQGYEKKGAHDALLLLLCPSTAVLRLPASKRGRQTALVTSLLPARSMAKLRAVIRGNSQTTMLTLATGEGCYLLLINQSVIKVW